MKLLPNISYAYQIIDRSSHSVTKYLKDEKTHAALNKKVIKRLAQSNGQLYEVELVKSEIDLKNPSLWAFFIFQYAELKFFELYYDLPSKTLRHI